MDSRKDLPLAGGHFVRGGAVAGRELVRGREPGDVGDVADDGRGDDRSDAEYLSQAGAGGADRGGELVAGIAELGVEAAQVSQVLAGQVVPGRGHGIGGVVCSEDRGCAGDGDVLADAARDDLAQDSVQPAGGLAAEPGQLAVPPGPDPQDKSMIIGADLLADGRAERGDRDRPGVIRVVLVRCPGGQQPDPRAELGLHVHDLLARTRNVPSGTSAASIATVWDPLCGSTPIITAAIKPSSLLADPGKRA